MLILAIISTIVLSILGLMFASVLLKIETRSELILELFMLDTVLFSILTIWLLYTR